jgi:hypothetical protein
MNESRSRSSCTGACVALIAGLSGPDGRLGGRAGALHLGDGDAGEPGDVLDASGCSLGARCSPIKGNPWA